jgi:hypothetical protein
LLLSQQAFYLFSGGRERIEMPATIRKFTVRHQHQSVPKELQPIGSSLPAYDAGSTDSTANREKILHDRAMEAAKNPISGFAMTAFMMYMMGNQINIMTMMFLFYQVMAPFNAILNIDKTFAQFEPDGVKKHLPRTIFILGQCAIFGFLLYKLKGMGLLPTESSDWLAMWPIKEVSRPHFFVHIHLTPIFSAYGTVWGWVSVVALHFAPVAIMLSAFVCGYIAGVCLPLFGLFGHQLHGNSNVVAWIHLFFSCVHAMPCKNFE